MLLNWARRNGKLYVRLLLAITLTIVLALIVTASIYYFTFSSVLQKDAHDASLTNLRQTSQSVAKATEIAQNVSFQIYRSSTIAPLLYYTNPDPFDTQGGMLALNNYLSTMPFIHSIYVYNEESGHFFIVSQDGQAGVMLENEIDDIGISEILDNYQAYNPFTPIPRILLHPKSNEKLGVYTYLLYDAIGIRKKINSAVIVNLSASWFNEELGYDNMHTTTFLIDDRKQILSTADLTEAVLAAPDQHMIESVISDQSSGYVTSSFNGQKSLITYTDPDIYDWYYVRVTPYTDITEKLSTIRIKTIQVTLMVMGAGLLLSWLLSRHLYVPIHKIEKQMRHLESERRNSSYTVRQTTLRKLLQIQNFNASVQVQKLKSQNISFDFTNPYLLAYIRIDQFSRLKEKHPTDLMTFRFAIMNIGTEICSKLFYVEAVDLEEDSILLLLNPLHNMPEAESIIDMLQDIQMACHEYIKLNITIAISPVMNNPHQLHSQFLQLRDSSYLRFFKGYGSIIELEKQQLEDKGKYSFPIGKEKRMIDFLMSGKIDEAKGLYAEIMLETSHYPIEIAASASTHMSITLGNMLDEIERNSSLELGFRSQFIIPTTKQFETIEEHLEAIDNCFDLLKIRLFEKRSNKHEDLIRKINQLIIANYSDPNLSLNSIAEELKLSSYHISRVYRQHTLTALVDSINEYRIGKAKELLAETKQSVTDIAEQTGYTSSSYFHRMFKKLNGVTPADYRKAISN